VAKGDTTFTTISVVEMAKRIPISTIQLRDKWAIDKGPNIANGTVVLVKEDNIPRPLHWKLGKICPLPFVGNPGKE